MPDRLDVLIVGGGPAGATVGALLRRYAPGLEVGIVEREHFPRHHVGESQLPAVSAVLDEMGAWDAVEAAGFPIKVGATFSWGRDAESWDFDFLPADAVGDPARPGRYEGVRRSTAFQVDRARYDEILLRHAAARGCHVEEGQGVRAVERSGDRIDAVVMEDGTRRRARHYVDASGSGAVLRRGLGIGAQQPTALRHSALYAYWRDADWAVRIGTSATRIQVRSLPYGWLWFIPLGTDRTSVGLVVPTAWLRGRRSSPETLYEEAVRADSEIASLLGRARREGELRAVRDWSHRAERVVGENWIVVGDAAGFADPILSAGMTLAHTSARNAACHLLEIDRGEHETDWLRARYQDRTCRTVDQHLRFARYWYAANGCFDDLQAHCREIAAEGGLDLAPEGPPGPGWRAGASRRATPCAPRQDRSTCSRRACWWGASREPSHASPCSPRTTCASTCPAVAGAWRRSMPKDACVGSRSTSVGAACCPPRVWARSCSRCCAAPRT